MNARVRQKFRDRVLNGTIARVPIAVLMECGRGRRLRDPLLFDGVPKIRGQSDVILRQHLIQGPLRAFRHLEGRFPALGGFLFVLFQLGLEVPIHPVTPHARQPERSSVAAHPGEKMASMGRFWASDVPRLRQRRARQDNTEPSLARFLITALMKPSRASE